MFKERTDLALETHEINVEKNIDDGIVLEKESYDEIEITKIKITNKEGEQSSGMKQGIYITFSIGKVWEKDSGYIKKCKEQISSTISSLLPKLPNNEGMYLVVGLGNRRIISDAIGPKVIDRLLVTHHIKALKRDLYDSFNFSDVCAISPGVLGDTGMESLDVVKSVTKEFAPKCIILIDALASRNIDRLATTVQICNVGISPGSGVDNHREEINENTLGVPIISIGVPTVVDAQTMVYNILGKENLEYVEKYFVKEDNFFVSLKESDTVIEYMSEIISDSLNLALHKSLSYEDLKELIK